MMIGIGQTMTAVFQESMKQKVSDMDYGNCKLLFRRPIYHYDMDNGGRDYGNKKYNFKT